MWFGNFPCGVAHNVVRQERLVMPLHDWKRVPAGLFHHFYQHWDASPEELRLAVETGIVPQPDTEY